MSGEKWVHVGPWVCPGARTMFISTASVRAGPSRDVSPPGRG